MKRRAALIGNIVSANMRTLALPYRLTYIVTNRCQLKCASCNIWKKDHSGELSPGEIEKIFTIYDKFSWVNLSGGEIFLRDDIVDIVKTIYRVSPNLSLLDFPTNGFMTDRIAGAVEEILSSCAIPRIYVTVSIDGTRALHDTLRGVEESWDKAIATYMALTRMKRRGFRPFLGFTLQTKNLDHFDAAFDEAKESIPGLRHEDVHVNVAHESGHYYDNEGCLDKGETELLWSRLRSISGKRKSRPFDPVSFMERRYQNLAGSYLKTGKMPLPCEALSSSLFMDPVGTIYPCAIFDKPIGNIRDLSYDIRKIWSSTGRKDIREKIKNGACPGCWTPCEAYQAILANLFRRKGAGPA